MDQRCLACARDTTAGSSLFASRKRAMDLEAKVEGYLCYSCQAGTAAAGSEESVPARGRYVIMDHPGGLGGF